MRGYRSAAWCSRRRARRGRGRRSAGRFSGSTFVGLLGRARCRGSARAARGRRRTTVMKTPIATIAPRDDETDEQDDDTDREADGPEARAGDVRVFRMFAVRVHVSSERIWPSWVSRATGLATMPRIERATLGERVTFCYPVHIPPSADRRARESRRSSRSRPATPALPPPVASRSRRFRAYPRRTASRWRGRDGRRGPR